MGSGFQESVPGRWPLTIQPDPLSPRPSQLPVSSWQHRLNYPAVPSSLVWFPVTVNPSTFSFVLSVFFFPLCRHFGPNNEKATNITCERQEGHWRVWEPKSRLGSLTKAASTPCPQSGTRKAVNVTQNDVSYPPFGKHNRLNFVFVSSGFSPLDQDAINIP